MQVSAISSIPYGTGLDYRFLYVSDSGNNIEASFDNSTSSSDKEGKLYSNINQWKHFCYKQIDAGILDIIA